MMATKKQSQHIVATQEFGACSQKFHTGVELAHSQTLVQCDRHTPDTLQRSDDSLRTPLDVTPNVGFEALQPLQHVGRSGRWVTSSN